jgi:hypothetical protein
MNGMGQRQVALAVDRLPDLVHGTLLLKISGVLTGIFSFVMTCVFPKQVAGPTQVPDERVVEGVTLWHHPKGDVTQSGKEMRVALQKGKTEAGE